MRTLALVILSALGAASANAEPVSGGSRIAVQGGWRWVPNARFVSQAAASGHPLEGASPGGPAVTGVFAYRFERQLELAIEIGWSAERFRFQDGPEAQLSDMPLLVMVRWSPWVGRWTPYLGLGGGYYLNFISGGPSGGFESHGAGPSFAAGVMVEVSERIGLVLEYRLGFARVGFPGAGFVNTGGNVLGFGAQIAFGPEQSGLK